MKKFLSISVIAIAVVLTLASCDKEDDVAISPSAMTNEVHTFLGLHFQGIEIQHVIQDKEHRTFDYELILADGTRIEINQNGEWIEVENYQKGIPNSVVPSNILEYVNKSYPDLIIVDIERDHHIDVKLKNGVELEFTLDGEFVRIDF